MLLVAVITGWAASKHCASGGLKAAEIEAGVVLMRTGIEAGDPGVLDDAEDHFVDAASVSVVDAYPAFLLRTNRSIQATLRGEPERPDPLVDAVAKRDWEAARKEIETLGPPGTKPREYWERLLAELGSTRGAR